MPEIDLLGDPVAEPLPAGERLRYFDQLVGHKILAVFEGTECEPYEDVVIVTETKCWLTAQAEHDGDSAYIVVSNSYRERNLSDYVKAKRLLETGCINQGEYEVLSKAEAEKEAVKRERIANHLRQQLAELEARAGLPLQTSTENHHAIHL